MTAVVATSMVTPVVTLIVSTVMTTTMMSLTDVSRVRDTHEVTTAVVAETAATVVAPEADDQADDHEHNKYTDYVS